MSAHAPPGTREPETKALLFRGGCLQPARGMRLAALTHWLPAKSFFFHSPFPSAPPSLPPPSPSSSQPAVFSSGLTSGGNIQNLCLCACTYSRIPLLESIALEIVSRWYRIDASGAVEREGGKVLDGCGFRCYHWIWNRERRARIRGRKLIFEYLEIDFDIYRREFWIIVIAWYR